MQKFLKLSGLFVLVAILISVAGISEAKVVTPESLNAVEEHVKANMEKFGVPGMSLVVVSDGQVVYNKGFGSLEKGAEGAVDSASLFQIASVSKSFTALAIMQLEDRGLLSTDDLVSKYLPWYATKDSERSAKITIKHLLQHTSGIPRKAYGLEIKNGTMDQLEEQVKRISEVTLIAEPGSRHEYSNLNYWTLALIVEKVSGLKFADYMEQNVFTPLGMERTGYINEISDMDNVATGHRLVKGQSKVFRYSIPGTTIAAGGVYTSSDDMAKYITMMINKGKYNENVLLSEAAYTELFTDGVVAWSSVDQNGVEQVIKYGYGWFIFNDNGTTVYQHGGDNPNYTAEMVVSPENNLGVAILSNSQHPITHRMGQEIYNYLQWQEEMVVAGRTRIEAGLQTVNMITLGTFIVLFVLALYLLIVGLGLRKGKYVIFRGRPGIIRLILQVILFPLIGIAVGGYCFTLPAQVIGSTHIALLYEGDLVKSVFMLAGSLIIFGITLAVLGFVKKAEKAAAASNN